ncbi:PEP-CTERM sorting domain-containing protein [Neptunomonas sp.]|uniref:PEP-CTERM sorting domain-containing protein n=1 Tax=Neptunomonas sp. TaxID=1971898 RepID=UPI0025E856A2|nr:PEP-CTERM sorting domain-containing protein [Neptunomonas sp.]
MTWSNKSQLAMLLGFTLITSLPVSAAIIETGDIIPDGDVQLESDINYYVGRTGVGELVVENGGQLIIQTIPPRDPITNEIIRDSAGDPIHSDPFLVAGRRLGSQGTITVDGAGSRISAISNAGTGGSIQVGRNGLGTMTVSNDAQVSLTDQALIDGVPELVTSSNTIMVGRDKFGQGQLNVDNGNVSVEGTGASIHIGRHGGNGSALISNQGSVSILDKAPLGHNDGASLNLGLIRDESNRASLDYNSDPNLTSTGSLRITSGSLNIDSLNSFSTLRVGRVQPDKLNGTGTINGQATGVLDISGNDAVVNIQSGYQAKLIVTDGPNVDGRATLSDEATINITATTDSARTDSGRADLEIGRSMEAGAVNNSTASMTISSGSKVNVHGETRGRAFVGIAFPSKPEGATSVLTIDGVGSSLKVSSDTFVASENPAASKAGNLVSDAKVFIGSPTTFGGGNANATVNIQNGGMLTAAEVWVGNGGEIKGSGGKITADLINDGGIIGPGFSPGILSIDGDYTQTASGRLVMEVFGASAGSYDILNVSGDMHFIDAIVEIVFTDAFLADILLDFSVMPVFEDMFVAGGDIFGLDSDSFIAHSTSGRMLNVDFANSQWIDITASSVPEPSTFLLLLAGIITLLYRRKQLSL